MRRGGAAQPIHALPSLRSVAMLLGAGVAGLLLAPPAMAQTVSGNIFHDRNANGIRDAGEESLDAVQVRLLGQRDAGGTFDQSITTSVSGGFSFNPGNGCYVFDVVDPSGWRRTLGRTDEFAPGSSGYTAPVGVRRWGGTNVLQQNLTAGRVRFTALGDSIAVNFNTCFDTGFFFYELAVRDRLRCVAPTAQIDLDQSAISGEHSDDLLVDDADGNNVYRTIERQPNLVTISMIGNDLLNNDPADNASQAEKNAAAAELIDSRQNLQEALSALTSEIPAADIEINTLYDNLANNCSTRIFRREWTPILQRVLRDLAWGQTRRATNADVYPEFAHEDLNRGCTGFRNQICTFVGDGIHPKKSGYDVIREKLWESLDGVNLGSKDPLGATSQTIDQGFLQRVLRLYPSRFETRGGATVVDAAAALSAGDGGAGASIALGLGAEEFRLSGFPDWYDEVTPVKVIAGVRYRTTGTVSDDFYRVEASVDDTFRPPSGHNYTATDWIYFTPIVGGGGPNAPVEDPDYPSTRLLALPNVANYREVSATVMKNPTRASGAAQYTWPPVSRAELGTATVRVAAAAVANTPGDNYRVVVDYVYLDVYGTTKPRPAEVLGLRVTKGADGALVLDFDQLTSSELYNVYFGTLSALQTGSYDHGNDTRCNVPTSVSAPGRLSTTVATAAVPAASSYLLVTGRVDGVESPSGFTSASQEIDRSQNRCP
ncbi:MAG: SdrD B-like domain-containing protein [Acidobacteriota bacterium]